MSYDPHAVPSPWQQPRPSVAKAIAHPSRLDHVRLARLGILGGLVCFWVAVLMAVF